jgi:hypothetical protein
MKSGGGDVETDVSSTATVIAPYLPAIDGGTYA